MAAQRLIIAGGGLAGGLAALALARMRPKTDLLLVEETGQFGGNHIWSFFDGDIGATAPEWLRDLVVHHWPAYEVRFPARRRTLATGYNSISSDRLDAVLRAALPATGYRLGTAITAIAENAVTLADGTMLAADGVIDARGLRDGAALAGLDLGWQKFVGREYRFAAPHGVTVPMVMDATVDQADGYRFVYCLPFSPTEMLVEDTYYNDDPALDEKRVSDRIDRYVQAQHWPDGEIVRQERGVLPVAMGGDIDTLWAGAPVAQIGMRGGFFHPTTGYSLPDAVRTAQLLAAQPDVSSVALRGLFHAEARRLWATRGFYRLLNRMLFRAAVPAERYRVLQHFYRLDAALIERFYSAQSSWPDRLRMLSGRPPVPLGRVATTLFSRQMEIPA